MGCSTWIVFKKWHKLNDFIANFFVFTTIFITQNKKMSDSVTKFWLASPEAGAATLIQVRIFSTKKIKINMRIHSLGYRFLVTEKGAEPNYGCTGYFFLK
jgi:hypothetical protein